jgi:hypothetical protein
MITGEIRNKVDQLWNTFWSGGVSNPLSVIEQITYLLFAKRLDDIHNNKLQQAKLLGEKLENPIFNKNQDHLRWSHFEDFEPLRKFEVFRDDVFPFIKSLNGQAGSSYTKFMKDAVFIIPNPALLDKVVNMIDAISMEDRDTKGDRLALNRIRYQREFANHHLENAAQLPDIEGDALGIAWDIAENPPRVPGATAAGERTGMYSQRVTEGLARHAAWHGVRQRSYWSRPFLVYSRP